jgi:L-rhamnono-1,4-lactonase
MSNTYIKLSGAFSELPNRPTISTDVASQIKPWVERVVRHFGPRRMMFGSDWPVCNVNGPTDESPWQTWTRAVEKLLGGLVEPDEQHHVWRTTATEAYKLQLEG